MSSESTPEDTEEHLIGLRKEAAIIIQRSWKKHHLKQLSTAVARIHELESIITRFVQADITVKLHELQEELGKKNNLCAIIEKQNDELTERLYKLQKDSMGYDETQKMADENMDEKTLKEMTYSMKELSVKADQLSDLYNAAEHEKETLKSDFVALNAKHKSDKSTIAELRHNLKGTIAKHEKKEFQLRALRNKLRDATSFKEQYCKLQNKYSAEQKRNENAMNELKKTHWSTIQQMKEYKRKDLAIEPLKIEIKQYQKKYEQVRDDYRTEQSRNDKLKNEFDGVSRKYHQTKKSVDDLQNDNHKLMLSNQKLLEDCMKFSMALNRKKAEEVARSPRTLYFNEKNLMNVLDEKEELDKDYYKHTLERCNFVIHWTVEQVGHWLKKHLPKLLQHQAKISEYIDCFRSHGIDGAELLLMDETALSSIGIDTEHLVEVYECISVLKRNPIEHIRKYRHLILPSESKETQTISGSSNENKETQTTQRCSSVPISNGDEPPVDDNTVKSAESVYSDGLSFTDTNSSNFSVQCFDEEMMSEYKELKVAKNRLIVSIKILTKQLRKCIKNNERGKAEALRTEIEIKRKALEIAKERIGQMKRIMQNLEKQNNEKLSSKSFVEHSKNNLDYSDAKSERKEILNKSSTLDWRFCFAGLLGTEPNTTKDEVVSQKEKTFSDIISDSESFIFYLRASNNLNDDNTDKESSVSKKSNAKSSSTMKSSEYDSGFDAKVKNPFGKTARKHHNQSHKSLLNKINRVCEF